MHKHLVQKWLNGTMSYKDKMPTKVDQNQLSDREKFLLNDSKVFCMLPWTHLHAFANGKAYPCCVSEHQMPIGDLKQHSIQETWNSDAQKTIRKNMLNEQTSPECAKCYEQDQLGWTSLRQSSNVHFGHHIDKIQKTDAQGHYSDVNMIYWDIRFSNLCNLSCRTCGSMFSSNWYDDQTAIWGKPDHDKITYAGRSKTDAYDQLVNYLPMVERIYFAGGEPLIMEEHYKILKELIKLGKADQVRLVYNTNFSKMAYKDLNVLDIWPEFKDVSVGASLDAMGARAELLRNGTVWTDVERNREDMLKKAPNVDFYISCTLSAFNHDHVVDFHQDWIAKGYITAKDWNMNVVQDPMHYRIDILPDAIKQRTIEKYKEHITMIKPLDTLGRATEGFKSGINMMTATDNTKYLDKFREYIRLLDQRRSQQTEKVFPELKEVLDV